MRLAWVVLLVGLGAGGPAPSSAAEPIDAIRELQTLCFATKADPVSARSAALKRGFLVNTSDQLELNDPYKAVLTFDQQHLEGGKSKLLGPIDLKGCKLTLDPATPISLETFRHWFELRPADDLPWSGYVHMGVVTVSKGVMSPVHPGLAAGNSLKFHLDRDQLGLLIVRRTDNQALELYFGQIKRSK